MRQFPVMFSSALLIATLSLTAPASQAQVSLDPSDVARSYVAAQDTAEHYHLTRATTTHDHAGATWVAVPMANGHIINNHGRTVRSREVPVEELADDDGDDGDGHIPGNLSLRGDRDYIVFVGDRQTIGNTGQPMTGNMAFAALDDLHQGQQSTAPILDRIGANGTAVYVGSDGPVSDRPVSRVSSIPFDPAHTAALAFYVSGDDNGRGSLEGMASGDVTFNVGDVAEELSVGLRGSASANIDLMSLLSNPVGNLIQMQNGWFVSDRVSVRVMEFAGHTLNFIARAQVDDSMSTLGIMGWFGASIDIGGDGGSGSGH